LVIPPETEALLLTMMPTPVPPAVIAPELMIVPWTLALLIVMPVAVGTLTPVGVIVPIVVLVTLPDTVALLTSMQLIADEFETDACDPEVTLMSHAAANAAGEP
jgi:hypothetical protein